MGACSWSWRKESASKHWLCVQTVDLQGVTIRRVEIGSLSDMTLDPTSMSGSLAFFITNDGSVELGAGRARGVPYSPPAQIP